jgi:hypothetical protein
VVVGARCSFGEAVAIKDQIPSDDMIEGRSLAISEPRVKWAAGAVTGSLPDELR